MSSTFQCDDKDTLIAFVYGEVDEGTHRQVKAHLRACASCADEVEGLQAVRRDLLEWQPPEMALNFSIVQKPATVLRPARWSIPPLPAWTQAAAAVLLFATGIAIANVQVRYGTEGLTVATGWMTPVVGPGPTAGRSDPTTGTDSSAPPEDWRPALVALEQSLRAEMQSIRRAQPEVREVSAPANVDTNALMRRVDARINETERKQREELAARMTQFARDMQTDLFRLNQGFRQLQGKTGLIEGNQRQMIDLVRRVSTQPIP